MWDPNKFEAERIQCKSNICLTMQMTCKISKFSFFLSNVYAPNLLSSRRRFLSLLTNHRKVFKDSPQLIGGDFNFALNVEDKLGGRVKFSTSMQDLRDFIDTNELLDMDLKGNRYTWSNRRIGKGFIMRRLDWILVSQDWISQYQNADLSSLP